jgi:predicted transcriptional regulator
MAIDNSRLVFAKGNQWVKEKDSAPFFGLPAWWRRFMFQLLTPREVTVYLYLCSVMDPNAVAYPTVDQIAEDMAIKSRSVIVEALNRLIEMGFLLRGAEPYNGRVMGKRVVYQRPLPHYTILKLLELGLIDAELYPTANQTRKDELTKASDEVVRAGLRRLLGDSNFAVYQTVKNPERRIRALVAALDQHVRAATVFATKEEQETHIDLQSVLPKLTPTMRAIVEEDQAVGVPF